jgi:cytochrome c oxidase subunit 3
MRLFRQLMEKPWLPATGPAGELDAEPASRLPAATLGLRVFLAVVTVLFSLLLIAYAERMAYVEWRPSPQPGLLWLNTAFLVLASVAMQWASTSAGRGRLDDVKRGLIGGGAFAVAFLVGQMVAWRQLQLMAPFDITDAAIAFFYLITALHGLHLVGGLGALARIAAKLWHGGADEAELRLGVQLCAVYWHFLLLVWLVLFGLLFSGNENLEILLAICGFR